MRRVQVCSEARSLQSETGLSCDFHCSIRWGLLLPSVTAALVCVRDLLLYSSLFPSSYLPAQITLMICLLFCEMGLGSASVTFWLEDNLALDFQVVSQWPTSAFLLPGELTHLGHTWGCPTASPCLHRCKHGRQMCQRLSPTLAPCFCSLSF